MYDIENYYEAVLKYCADEYNYIVFRTNPGQETLPGFCQVKQFWTLEKNEDDAKRRVENETKAYDSPDWQFFYRPLKRVQMQYTKYPEPITEVKVDW